MTPITLVYSYYDQKPMLQEQYRVWSGYPADIKRHLSIILVDDCSPNHPAHEVERPHGLPIDLSIHRVLVDKRWGWPKARNLGVHEAADGWCLVTDMDHVVTAENMVKLLGMGANGSTVYRPVRVKPNGEPYKRHNDTYLITRELFWKTGGYTLQFVGWYGTSSIFTRRLELFAPILTTEAFTLTVYNLGGEDIGPIKGAGVTGMGRKGSEHHVSRSPLAHLTKTAHLTAPVAPLDFPHARML